MSEEQSGLAGQQKDLKDLSTGVKQVVVRIDNTEKEMTQLKGMLAEIRSEQNIGKNLRMGTVALDKGVDEPMLHIKLEALSQQVQSELSELADHEQGLKDTQNTVEDLATKVDMVAEQVDTLRRRIATAELQMEVREVPSPIGVRAQTPGQNQNEHFRPAPLTHIGLTGASFDLDQSGESGDLDLSNTDLTSANASRASAGGLRSGPASSHGGDSEVSLSFTDEVTSSPKSGDAFHSLRRSGPGRLGELPPLKGAGNNGKAGGDALDSMLDGGAALQRHPQFDILDADAKKGGNLSPVHEGSGNTVAWKLDGKELPLGNSATSAADHLDTSKSSGQLGASLASATSASGFEVSIQADVSVDDSLELEKCDHIEDVQPSNPSSPVAQLRDTAIDRIPTATKVAGSPSQTSKESQSPSGKVVAERPQRAGLLGILPSLESRTSGNTASLLKSSLEASDGSYEDEAFDEDAISESIDESIEGFDESSQLAGSGSKADGGEV